MPTPDTILQGRYRVIRQLGHGGMGAVYEAFDLRLSRTVALKETSAKTDELHRAFQREARLLANLRHPSLPNVLDHFIEGEGQFLVMEYIAGPDLAQMLVQRGRSFLVPQVLKWADELLNVLDYLHNHKPPIIHRDIKPANLKLGAEGQIILFDFGLAKGSAGGMTVSGVSRSVSGYSPHYAPLEQSYGEKSDPSSDLYAAAATIYHLVTGHIPEEAAHRASILISEGRDPLLLANQWNPEVPIELAVTLSWALSLKAGERPGSAAEMKTSLRNGFTDRVQSKTQYTPSSQNNNFQETIYPTIPVKPELVSDPFKVRETIQKENRAWGKWVFTAILCCALVVGIYLLYLSRHITEDRTISSTAAGQPVKPAIPSPYREALGSLVSLEMKDVDGKSIGHASGFFIADDEIATDLSAIQGTFQGTATLLDGSSYPITAVSATDRERGLAILKINGGKGKPLVISSDLSANVNDKVAVLSVSTNAQANYSPTIITDTKGKDDALEIGISVDPIMRGAPLVNSKGEVIAMVVSSAKGENSNQAVTASRLFNLMKVNQPAASLGMAGAKELLYDFRQEGSEKEKTISPEEKQRVLSAVFKSYLTDNSQCSDFEGDATTPEGLKNVRDAGYIVPDVSDKATGSFTEPGIQQTAYLVWVGECGAPHVVNWGTKRLAVFTGQTLVVNVDVKDHTAILGTYDLNGDGVKELLITGGYMQSGLVTEWGALINVKDKHLRFDKKFDIVRESTCASMDPKPSVTAAVIYYTKGGGDVAPEIRVDNYQAKCTAESDDPKPSAFRYVTSGKLPKS